VLAMGEMTGRFAVIVTTVTGVIIYPTTGQKRLMSQNSLTNTMGGAGTEKLGEKWQKLRL